MLRTLGFSSLRRGGIGIYRNGPGFSDFSALESLEGAGIDMNSSPDAMMSYDFWCQVAPAVKVLGIPEAWR